MFGFASYLIQIQREPDVAVGSLCCEKKNINILDNIEIFCYKHTIKYLSFNLSHKKKTIIGLKIVRGSVFEKKSRPQSNWCFIFLEAQYEPPQMRCGRKKWQKHNTQKHKYTNTQSTIQASSASQFRWLRGVAKKFSDIDGLAFFSDTQIPGDPEYGTQILLYLWTAMHIVVKACDGSWCNTLADWK